MAGLRKSRWAAMAIAAAGLSGVSGTPSARAAQPVLQAEQSTVATLPTMSSHWFLPATGSESYTLYNGDTAQILGTLPGDLISNAAFSPDGKTFYVAVTMWARGDHGPREDFLRAYDAHTLALVKEIELPPRALAVYKIQNMDLSQDGHWAYIFDMSPATGITVIDLKAGKVVRTVDTPGCALVFPWKSGGLSSLCGDGSLTNVAVDASGAAKVSHVAPFFDANNDPVFEQSPIDRHAGIAFFITYTGKVFETSLGATPTIGTPWTLSAAAGQPVATTGVQDVAWRPGGKEPFAYQRATRQLYALMHMGTYWTHKREGNEIWVYDTTAHTLLRRIALPADCVGIAVSQDQHPLLYALTGEGKAFVMDAASGKVLHTIDARIGGIALTPDL
ncbi:amine dehydrogenase [Ameyamaea chiangmaiensis]|uniref:Amine dehydrogenase n=2 Tax=Ameyamaea chiangmaiensis TaxID=442969 RepID=A0A850PED3_9PROT|nr:amine dehydrogenase [Ameyamaea chiangmaiensis]NVN39421.1 amine dehydrogenase [Ameyamaea chiangmaiensis]